MLCALRQRASGCPRELHSLYGELRAILGQSRGRRSSRTHPHIGDSDHFYLFSNGFITPNFQAPQGASMATLVADPKVQENPRDLQTFAWGVLVGGAWMVSPSLPPPRGF